MALTVLNGLTRGGRWIFKNGPEAGEGGGGDGQGPKPGEGQTPNQPGDKKESGQEPRTYDETYVSNLRNESAGYRTRLKELETTSGATITDLTKKLETALGELTTLREGQRQANFLTAAQREGAKYPDAVAALIPPDTKPEDLAAVIKALRKTHPDLFNFQDGDGGKKGDEPSRETSPGLGTLRAAYAAKDNKEK